MGLADDLRAGPPQHKADTRARILTFDIETRPHLAWIWDAKTRYVTPDKIERRGAMFSWAAKWYGEKPVEFRSDFHDGNDVMIERLHALLTEADIVVGYNSDRFDIKRVNAEFLRVGLPKPSPYRSVDLIKTLRSQFAFPYFKLDEVARELSIPGKTAHSGFQLWKDCMAGDPRAWALMRRYNMQDVRLTEQVYDFLRAWIPNHPNLALWTGHDDDGRPIEACCNCGALDIKIVPGKLAYTAMTAYALVQCQACKAFMRRNIVKERIGLRPVR